MRAPFEGFYDSTNEREYAPTSVTSPVMNCNKQLSGFRKFGELHCKSKDPSKDKPLVVNSYIFMSIFIQCRKNIVLFYSCNSYSHNSPFNDLFSTES